MTIRALGIALAAVSSATMIVLPSGKANADPQEPKDPRLQNAMIFCLEINDNPTEQGVDNAIANLMNHVGGGRRPGHKHLSVWTGKPLSDVPRLV